MPAISPVDATPAAQPADLGVPGPGSQAAPAPGFQAALGQAFDAAALSQLVTLGEFVGSSAAPAAPAAAAGAVSSGGTIAAVGAPTGPVEDGNRVIEAAKRYLGVPYKWGGTDPAKGLDCSGFVQRVYADLGISLPRVSVDQAKQGTAVASLEQAQPGDLVFWSGSPNHIGIYAGGGRMIVAPRSGDVVKVQDITRTPHAIRRIV